MMPPLFAEAWPGGFCASRVKSRPCRRGRAMPLPSAYDLTAPRVLCLTRTSEQAAAAEDLMSETSDTRDTWVRKSAGVGHNSDTGEEVSAVERWTKKRVFVRALEG